MSTRERVDTLENALKELAYAGRRTEMSIDRLAEQTQQTEANLAGLHDELQDRAARMDANLESLSANLKEGWQETKAHFAELHKESEAGWRQTREEISDLSAELRAMRRKAFEEWGHLANKRGSFVEDMVVPNFPHILERYFGIGEVEDRLVRRRKPHPADKSRKKEFDLIAWTSDTVFWNETKSNPSVEAFSAFVRDDESVFEYFPELAGRKLVKIASALFMSKELVDFLTKHGCYAMMLGEETMDLINFEALLRSS